MPTASQPQGLPDEEERFRATREESLNQLKVRSEGIAHALREVLAAIMEFPHFPQEGDVILWLHRSTLQALNTVAGVNQWASKELDSFPIPARHPLNPTLSETTLVSLSSLGQESENSAEPQSEPQPST